MRKVIVDERAMNPKYYDRMSELLDALIERRRQGAIEYQEYLDDLIEQARKLGSKESETAYPVWAASGALRALVDFGLPSEDLATAVDRAVRESKPDQWVGNAMKEKRVKRALRNALPADYDRLDELFDLVRARHEYV